MAKEMTVRELRKKYRGYMILLFGRPLTESTTPFTLLPRGKDLDDCIVADYTIINRPHEAISLGLDLRGRGKIRYEGTVKAYVR